MRNQEIQFYLYFIAVITLVFKIYLLGVVIAVVGGVVGVYFFFISDNCAGVVFP